MFPFIQTIFDGRQQFDWSMIVSDSIHNQMIKVRETKRFFMTFYVVYAVAQVGIFLGLQIVGILGEAQG